MKLSVKHKLSNIKRNQEIMDKVVCVAIKNPWMFNVFKSRYVKINVGPSSINLFLTCAAWFFLSFINTTFSSQLESALETGLV